MDHNTGRLRLDLEHSWASTSPPQPLLPSLDELCDSEVRSQVAPSFLRSLLICSGYIY